MDYQTLYVKLKTKYKCIKTGIGNVTIFFQIVNIVPLIVMHCSCTHNDVQHQFYWYMTCDSLRVSRIPGTHVSEWNSYWHTFSNRASDCLAAVPYSAWWHQAITWTNIDLSSKVFCGTHLRVVGAHKFVLITCSGNALLKLLPHLIYMINRNFLTWILVGWQHSCHITKPMLTDIDFNISFSE